MRCNFSHDKGERVTNDISSLSVENSLLKKTNVEQFVVQLKRCKCTSCTFEKVIHTVLLHYISVGTSVKMRIERWTCQEVSELKGFEVGRLRGSVGCSESNFKQCAHIVTLNGSTVLLLRVNWLRSGGGFYAPSFLYYEEAMSQSVEQEVEELVWRVLNISEKSKLMATGILCRNSTLIKGFSILRLIPVVSGKYY